jgi:hypothetical protein
MSTATLSNTHESAPGELHKISLETFFEMIRLGLIQGPDRVVLLDGLMVNKLGRGLRHLLATRLIFLHLLASLAKGWTLLKEEPLSLPEGPEGDSAPEPDVMVLSGGVRDYDERLPAAGDVALIIEVADSTLVKDRAGLVRYAWASLPEVWIVNLVNKTVELYTDPSGPADAPGYKECVVKGFGDKLAVQGRQGQILATVCINEIMEARED